MAHRWTHTAHPCTVTCSALPVAKGLGLRPFLHLGSTCSPKQGRILGIFYTSITVLCHLTSEAQESGLVPVLLLPPRSSFQGVPSLGSSIKGSSVPAGRGCKHPEQSCNQARSWGWLPFQPTARITGKRGADGRHIFRDTWQERGVSSPGRGNGSPASASVITGEGAGGCCKPLLTAITGV